VNRDRILYFVVSAASLGLITTANFLGGRALPACLADLCIPSLVVCACLYAGSRPARPLAPPWPTTPGRRVVRLAGVWLALWWLASAVAAVIVGHWIRYTSGACAIVCFVVLGPLQEELLFRGALYEWAERAWPTPGRWGPVAATTVPFALQHFQFHGYRLSGAALLQVAFTVPMGIVFARLRQDSGSVWPGWVVHVLTNLPGAFGSGAI